MIHLFLMILIVVISFKNFHYLSSFSVHYMLVFVVGGISRESHLLECEKPHTFPLAAKILPYLWDTTFKLDDVVLLHRSLIVVFPCLFLLVTASQFLLYSHLLRYSSLVFFHCLDENCPYYINYTTQLAIALKEERCDG